MIGDNNSNGYYYNPNSSNLIVSETYTGTGLFSGFTTVPNIYQNYVPVPFIPQTGQYFDASQEVKKSRKLEVKEPPKEIAIRSIRFQDEDRP